MLAYPVGNRQLRFDAATETFPDDPQANAYLKPAYPKHYRIPDTV